MRMRSQKAPSERETNTKDNFLPKNIKQITLMRHFFIANPYKNTKPTHGNMGVLRPPPFRRLHSRHQNPSPCPLDAEIALKVRKM